MVLVRWRGDMPPEDRVFHEALCGACAAAAPTGSVDHHGYEVIGRVPLRREALNIGPKDIYHCDGGCRAVIAREVCGTCWDCGDEQELDAEGVCPLCNETADYRPERNGSDWIQ